MTQTDQQIAASVQLAPIGDIAQQKLGLTPDLVTTYGKYKAKVATSVVGTANKQGSKKLVLVTGMSPTPAGEGKTTTTIGLTDGLNLLGVCASACLREPSLGPCFGMKGGAHGGGYSQVAPMEDINLHFNGDIHAVTAANNLLASMIDNHLYWGNQAEIDVGRVTWRRAVDLNDRALRSLDLQVKRQLQRRSGFDITAASEVMAILSLAEDRVDLQRRLGEIVVAYRQNGSALTVKELGVEGALAVLLNDAFDPNLVQTLERNPVFIHGGPFANIAHGCNSVVATRTALELSDVVVTEAGFGADLGAEKFIDIKCRQTGLRPDAVVIVCTIRSLKMQGGIAQTELTAENLDAIAIGFSNLQRHLENLQAFGLAPIVVLNHFNNDTSSEIQLVQKLVEDLGTTFCHGHHWAEGGKGAVSLARAVMTVLDRKPSPVEPLYENGLSISEKIECVASRIYRATTITFEQTAQRQLATLEELGYGQLPICIAKTQYSFTADPKLVGAPVDFDLPVRQLSLSAGAGFVVAICGDIMTMPGLPRRPAALDFSIDEYGAIHGLY